MLLFVKGFVGKRFHHAAERVPKTRKREQVMKAQERESPLDPLGHPYIGKGRDVVICLRPTREYKMYT